MSRLTHVLWSILDEELDSHDNFTIWLNLNEKKMQKSIQIQGQVKKIKKSNFQNVFFWKQRHVSEVESPQQSNGSISFPVSWL